VDLGAFSVSLAVANIGVSRAFYERLGFATVGGAAEDHWLILRNGETTIGLFEGMFEGNLLTFNPGWSAQAEALDEYTDVRDIQRSLVADGVALVAEADESTTGPASLMVVDPDGNTILIDQHVG
jgi:catechol 2,3-dioxygenase-like lactoylglutathione lyase family enzyme